MTRREPCVLFNIFVPDREVSGASGTLIEILRYAGALSIVKESHIPDAPEIEQISGTWYMLQLNAPRDRGLDVRTWAEQNAQRIASFGLKATASWRELS